MLALLSALELARLRRTCLSMQAAVDPIILVRLIALRPWDTDAYGRAQRLYWLEGGGGTDGSCRFCRRALVATPCTNKYRCKLGRCSNKHPCKRIDRRCPYVKCDGWTVGLKLVMVSVSGMCSDDHDLFLCFSPYVRMSISRPDFWVFRQLHEIVQRLKLDHSQEVGGGQTLKPECFASSTFVLKRQARIKTGLSTDHSLTSFH